MKTLVVIGIILTSFSAYSAPLLEGKCAKAVAKHIDREYKRNITNEGYMAEVISVKETSPGSSEYKVIVVTMDGGSEPFQMHHRVTVQLRSCKVQP